MNMIVTAIRMSVVLMVLCGLIYPFVTTGIAQVLFGKQANGSIVQRNGETVGSELLAQDVQSPSLFHPRASAAKYDPTASAGSNVDVASESYLIEMTTKIAQVKQDNPMLTSIPADLVTSSGSGFDPDLSPEAAKTQVSRISQATGLSDEQLNQLIDAQTKGRQLGIFGEPRVNVMQINLALLKLIK